MFFQFFNLFIRNWQAQFFFCLRKGDPQSSPGAEFLVRGKDVLHLLACIPLRKRALVSVICHRHCSPNLFYRKPGMLLESMGYIPARNLHGIVAGKAGVTVSQAAHHIL